MDDEARLRLKARFKQTELAVLESASEAQKLSELSDGKNDRARAYFKALTDMLELYAQKENFAAGSALNIFPPVLALQLARLCGHLADGIIPEPIADCAGRGNLVGPDERRDILAAVRYIVAAKAGTINDPSPVKTVAQLFGGLNRKSVQGWMQKHQATITPSDISDAAKIDATMRAAGSRYSRAGRSNNSISKRARDA